MRVYLSDAMARNQIMGGGFAGQLESTLIAEWVSKSFFFGATKRHLSIEAGLDKLDRLVARRALAHQPVAFDMENEKPSTLGDIAAAISGRYPRLKFGIYAKTSPRPPATDDAWRQIAPYVAMTVSQGWQNRKNISSWSQSVVRQADRWSVHFPGHIRAIAMRPWPHPNVIRRGFHPLGLIDEGEWDQMVRIAEQNYELCILQPPHTNWSPGEYWFQRLAEADPRLKNIWWKP